MSEHRVLNFDKPLEPDDIEVGNVIILNGTPRTITHVEPYHNAKGRYPHLGERLYADVGSGDKQVFCVATCSTCGTKRAFPGLQRTGDWYGLTHRDSYAVYCSTPCVIDGVLKSLDSTGDGAHT